MQGTASTLHSVTNGVRPIQLRAVKAVSRAMTLKFSALQLPLSSSFGRVFARHATCTGATTCDDVLIVAPGLLKALPLPLSSNRYSSRILILSLTCPSSIASSQVIASMTLRCALFSKRLCRPIHRWPVDWAWMQASQRWGYVLLGCPLAMMIGYSSMFGKRQLHYRYMWVSSTLYLTVSWIFVLLFWV